MKFRQPSNVTPKTYKTPQNLTNKLSTSISISLNAFAPSSVFLICSKRSRTVFFLICSCSCRIRSFSLSFASWRSLSSSAFRTFCNSASRCSSSSFSRWMFKLSRRSFLSSIVWRRARIRWCSFLEFFRKAVTASWCCSSFSCWN